MVLGETRTSPPSAWLSQPDFKYNCTYSHPPTIIISDYKLQKGKKETLLVCVLYHDNILVGSFNKKQCMSNKVQIQLEKHSFRVKAAHTKSCIITQTKANMTYIHHSCLNLMCKCKRKSLLALNWKAGI